MMPSLSGPNLYYRPTSVKGWVPGVAAHFHKVTLRKFRCMQKYVVYILEIVTLSCSILYSLFFSDKNASKKVPEQLESSEAETNKEEDGCQNHS